MTAQPDPHPARSEQSGEVVRCAPQRIQRQRTKGWRMPEGAVYVGRPTRWGNPVRAREVTINGVVVDVCDVQQAVDHYRNLVVDRASFHPTRSGLTNNVGGGFWHVTANPVNDRGDLVPTELEIRHALRGRDLACWCPLDRPCHADVLLEIANPREADRG